MIKFSRGLGRELPFHQLKGGSRQLCAASFCVARDRRRSRAERARPPVDCGAEQPAPAGVTGQDFGTPLEAGGDGNAGDTGAFGGGAGAAVAAAKAAPMAPRGMTAPSPSTVPSAPRPWAASVDVEAMAGPAARAAVPVAAASVRAATSVWDPPRAAVCVVGLAARRAAMGPTAGSPGQGFGPGIFMRASRSGWNPSRARP